MPSRSLFSVCLVLALGSVLCADVVYFNDFSDAVGPNLSVTPGTLAIMQPLPGCSSPTYCTPFLGHAGTTTPRPLDNHTVTLTLSGLPAHTQATVSLALFILASWDGSSGWHGPDYWELAVVGGPTLLSTTFSNVEAKSQCYPDNCPANNPRWTGSVEHNTLGVPLWGDSVYLLSYSFPHTGSSLALTFRAWTLQGWSDEGWGIDNLRVEVTGAPPSVIPEPATFAMLAGVLAALAALRRRTFLR